VSGAGPAPAGDSAKLAWPEGAALRTCLRPISLSGIALLAWGCTGSHPDAVPPPPREPGYVETPSAEVPSDPHTPRRLRRLTNREMENVFADLLGAPLGLTRGFLRDPRAEGYDNDSLSLGVSESKVDELAAAAERAAAYVSAPERIAGFAPCDPGAPSQDCARAFATAFATRGWGRAPSADELARLLAVFQVGQQGAAYPDGISLVAEAILQAPAFVYRSELGDDAAPAPSGQVRLTADEIASALSFTVTASRPDAELRAAAASGALFTPEGRERQVRRLLGSAGARQQLRTFLRAWLRLTDVATINKDLGVNPVFTPAVRFAMDRELDTFLDAVLDGPDRLDDLLLADYTFPGPALAPIYKEDLLDPIGSFTRVRLDSHRRRGLLSSPAFLATHALIDQSNPVQRGLMVRAGVLCQDVAPPPPDVVAVTPPGAPGVTTRAKYSKHSEDGRCRPCHQLMDAIGFGFEAFDTLGRYRTTDNGQPVDASGELIATDIDGPFTGPAELSQRLPRSAIFRRCFVRQMWRFGEGRSVEGPDEAEISGLAWRFEQDDHRITDLVVELVKRPTFILRRAEAMP
jgi:hypothetical protein